MAPEPGNLDALARYHADGWEQLDLNLVQAILIWGQLSVIKIVLTAAGPFRRWASASDIERIKAVPVALAFTIPESATNALPPDTETLDTVLMFPPAQFGEYALIPYEEPTDDKASYESSDQWHCYHIGVLGEDGAALWQQLGDALRALVAPAEWWLLTPEVVACMQPGGYARRRSELHSALLAARTAKERERVHAQLGELDTAHKHAETLEAWHRHTDQNLAEIAVKLREARAMAQQLAVFYWQHHLARFVPATTEPGEPATIADPSEPETPEPRRRGARVPRAALVVRDPATVQVKSDIFTQGIMRALRDGDAYTQYQDRMMAEYHSSLAKRKGDITITLKGRDDENWEQVLSWLNSLGDEVVDTFIAILALATDENGVDKITAPFWHSPDDGLAVCQRKQSHRAYTAEQRAAWIDNLRVLSRMHIRAEWPGSRKGRTAYIDSTLIDVLGQTGGERQTITGETIWERRQVKVGEWAHLMGTPYDNQTAVTFRKILSYHAQRDRYAKRLGLYLNLQFRVNAKKPGGVVERTMATLIEQAGIKPDLKHPGDTRRGIEDALAKLQRDGVIGAYGEVVDSNPSGLERRERIEQRAYGWWDDYEATLWHIRPPEAIRQQYRRLAAPGEADDSDG